jgi:hypothetical protein
MASVLLNIKDLRNTGEGYGVGINVTQLSTIFQLYNNTDAIRISAK